MPKSKAKTIRHVLFLDDDQDFLRLVQDAIAPLGAGSWQIICVTSPDAALEALKRQKIDLVVVDYNLRVLDGVQVLKLLGERYPDLKKVSLTSFASEENRSACLAAGAQLFIEKPRSKDGFKSIYAMLDDLMNWVPQQGFQGMLRRVGLQDVIQMECLVRNSSILEVYNERVLGRIYIENGNIIHAAGGDLTGEQALNHLLALPRGSFELAPFEMPPENTINGPWEFLLMEAARLRDEMAAQEPLPGEPKVDAETLTVSHEIKVRVAETLVCSGAGKELCNVDCPDAPGRVVLLQSVSRQSGQMKSALDMGEFDRVEWQLADGRAIAQTRSDRMIFVRVANL